MRLPVIFSALVSVLAISTAASAQTAAPAAPAKVKAGQAIYTADGASIGRIDYVQSAKDGTPQFVGVIYEMRVVHIPADSLSEGQKGLVTTLKRAEISKLK